MPLMKRLLILGLAIGLLAAAAAASVSLGLQASYYSPRDPAFKSIYGGGALFGGSLAFGLTGRLEGWIEGGFFSRIGALSYTKEETKLSLIPFGAGLRYRILPGSISPYVDAGARYYLYRETNSLGEAKTGGVGFVARLGLAIALSGRLGLDVQAGYSSCKLTPADFSIDVGGLAAGAGLTYSF
jgi:hypothetical protein